MSDDEPESNAGPPSEATETNEADDGPESTELDGEKSAARTTTGRSSRARKSSRPERKP